MPPTGDDLDRWAAAANRLWLFLDYDGTLADFAPIPERIEPQAEIVELLKQLSADPRFRVAVISGRRLEDVRLLLPVPGIFLAGIYGVEIQTPKGGQIYRAEYNSIRPILQELKSRWEEIVSGRSGFYVEDKGLALTLHIPASGQAGIGRVLTAARQAVDGNVPSDQFRRFDDGKLLEIAPLQAHKGQAVQYLLERFPFPAARLVYLGDDDRDQEAFEVVHALGGVAIQVFHLDTPVRFRAADTTLDSPRAARQWLEGLLSES